MEKLKKKHRLASPRNTNKTTVSNNPQKFQPSQTLRKRNPQRPATIPTDVYVSRSSNFKGQLLRAEKLLIKDSHPSITIHGLGAAIQKSINLVLALKDLTHNQIAYKVTTGTVELIDDIIPDDDDKDLEVQTRNNSSIRIQVWLKEGIEKFVANKNYSSHDIC